MMMNVSDKQVVRVMMIEDSLTMRQLLAQIIALDPRLELVAQASSAEQAIRTVQRVRPDVITMDIRLPGMDGYEATHRIMQVQPTPIVVVAAGVGEDDAAASIQALRAGALAVVEKPRIASSDQCRTFGRRLCDRLVTMSQVRVIRQRFNRPHVHLRRDGIKQESKSRPDATKDSVRSPTVGRSGAFDLIGVAASTGGPAALELVLGPLPADLPAAVCLVQHITPSFLDSFADWLDRLCALPVRIAERGQRITPGAIYLAPANRHLLIERGRACLTLDPPQHAERPSGSVLLHSIAASSGPRAIGVVLTGMGRDGADGLLAIRQAGGHTIAQDEATCVVAGMSGTARELGAAIESLPVQSIADRLIALTSTRTKPAAITSLPAVMET